VTLELNGFTMTGQGDPQTACGGDLTTNESGIRVDAQIGIAIRGPGIIQRFRNQGIALNTCTSATVTRVTISTNCLSGIFVNGGALNQLDGNISTRNGNPSNPCGGI
jgi:hypothetical protein